MPEIFFGDGARGEIDGLHHAASCHDAEEGGEISVGFGDGELGGGVE